MKAIFPISSARWMLYAFIFCIGASFFTGCKSSQKKAAAEAAARKEAARKQKVDRAVSDLRSLINDTEKSADELQTALNEIKGRGVSGDTEVARLIKLVEDKITQKRAEEARLAEEARKKAEAEKANRGPQGLDDYFAAISTAPTTEMANTLIDQALEKFSSPEADVLIIITMAGGKPDYDEPTTIVKYLNYLKDQQKNLNKVYKVERDAGGKIKLLELIRK